MTRASDRHVWRITVESPGALAHAVLVVTSGSAMAHCGAVQRWNLTREPGAADLWCPDCWVATDGRESAVS